MQLTLQLDRVSCRDRGFDPGVHEATLEVKVEQIPEDVRRAFLNCLNGGRLWRYHRPWQELTIRPQAPGDQALLEAMVAAVEADREDQARREAAEAPGTEVIWRWVLVYLFIVVMLVNLLGQDMGWW